MKRALFWSKEGRDVRCKLCPHLCLIDNSKVGYCFGRKNENGVLYPLNYARVSSKSLDPIEKKPFYNFHPGSLILSIGSIGCNLGCPFCQNYSIAHPEDIWQNQPAEEVINKNTNYLSVSDLVEEAQSTKNLGNIGVAYTYNEPFISFEYLLEACKAVKAKGLLNILVTNGYVNPKPLAELLPFIDAMNIDLKGIEEDTYRQLNGHVNPVERTISVAAKSCHVEVTNLLIPGLNDTEEQIKKLANWLALDVSPKIPLHFSRYFPARKLKTKPTSLEVLRNAEKIAKEKLDYVYLGNV